MDDNIFKVVSAAIVSFMSYCIYALKIHSKREDTQDKHIVEHDKKLAIVDEQMKHILEKLTDVVDLGIDLKRSNNTILRALARKSRKE